MFIFIFIAGWYFINELQHVQISADALISNFQKEKTFAKQKYVGTFITPPMKEKIVFI